MAIRAQFWMEDRLRMLDQRKLPQSEQWLELTSWHMVAEAIREMAVRGAPAIGVSAAYGIALAAQNGDDLCEAYEGLAQSRPTAVNLSWALDRMKSVQDQTFAAFLKEAKCIEREDLMQNEAIGEHGAELIGFDARVLTICNTGSLATSGHGTALGIIRSAHQAGKRPFVVSAETRPRLQGLRLTAWELIQDGIPFMSIVDGAAASLMKAGKIDIVVAGADRIAANGDTANKIGTYGLAVLAKHHDLPFVIAAPSSTIDPSMENGDLIPIEERSPDELTMFDGSRIAPADCPVFNPAFDVTPSTLISAIVTESGIHRQPYRFTR